MNADKNFSPKEGVSLLRAVLNRSSDNINKLKRIDGLRDARLKPAAKALFLSSDHFKITLGNSSRKMMNVAPVRAVVR